MNSSNMYNGFEAGIIRCQEPAAKQAASSLLFKLPTLNTH